MRRIRRQPRVQFRGHRSRLPRGVAAETNDVCAVGATNQVEVPAGRRKRSAPQAAVDERLVAILEEVQQVVPIVPILPSFGVLEHHLLNDVLCIASALRRLCDFESLELTKNH
ncbi:MAG: hypothetical protein QM784_39065 [Polyangiaceae bacterium]